MKRLQSLFGNTFHLLIVLVPVIAIVLLVGGQTLAGFRDEATISATQATAVKQQDVEALVFQSPLPTPTSPPSTGNLKVIAIEPVKNGPYRNILWSPDGKKALVSKQYTQYLLAREKGVSTEGLPPGFVPGTTTGLGDLWLLDLATGAERRLAEKVGRYAWSPDSTQVAYLAPTGAEGIAGALYVLDIASGRTKRMASVDFLGSVYTPQWLPTNEIVFVRDGRLRSVQATGKQEKALPGFRFYDRMAAEAGKPGYLDDPDAPVGFHFSPDGKRVAYKTHRQNYRAISYRLWLADADGSNAQLITEQAEGGYYEWSPDSQWLVFDTFRDVDDPTVDQHDPGLSGLWVVRADGSDVHPLHRTDGWRWILSPTWSPDSTMVVFIQAGQFTKEGNNDRELWVANVLERETATLLPGFEQDKGVTRRVWWSPDGHYLLTSSDTPAEGDRFEYRYASYRLILVTE